MARFLFITESSLFRTRFFNREHLNESVSLFQVNLLFLNLERF